MKITAINNNFNYYKTNFCSTKIKEDNKVRESKYLGGFASIPSILTIHSKEEQVFFENFLKQKGKVSLEQYQDVIRNHPRCLIETRKLCEEAVKEIQPKTAGKMAAELKKYFDEKYGNYTILSLGTSPACITETMKNLGAKVIFMPISGLFKAEARFNLFEEEPITLTNSYPNLKLAMDYCTQQGIADKNAGKIIILDYSASGKTLKKAERLLLERKDINPNEIVAHDLIKTLHCISCKRGDKISDKEVRLLDVALRYEYTEKLCNIPHFYYDFLPQNPKENMKLLDGETQEDFFKRMNDFSRPMARAWALCATHEAMKNR